MKSILKKKEKLKMKGRDKMKKLLTLILVLVPLFAFSLKEGKIIKIGYVNIQKALKSYSHGKRAVDFLKNLKESYAKKKNEMESELKKLEKELEMKSKNLTEKEVRAYLTQIESKRQELEIFVKNANLDIEKKEREMLKPLYQKILSTIKTEAQRLGYNFIIDSKYVLVADPELDLTLTIIKALEKQSN